MFDINSYRAFQVGVYSPLDKEKMFTTFKASGNFSALVTGKNLETAPAYVYKDGRKTSDIRTHRGQPLYRLRGALPLIDGEVLPDGFIYVTDAAVPDVAPGQILAFTGMLAIRAAKGFGLTGTLFGSLHSENETENKEFSLEDIGEK